MNKTKVIGRAKTPADRILTSGEYRASYGIDQNGRFKAVLVTPFEVETVFGDTVSRVSDAFKAWVSIYGLVTQ